jgi:CheY-like chemotaxis protein
LETLGAGISVTDVPSGEEAILVISRQPVELLISDVRLPGISGLELIERTRVRNPELRLILITGMTDDSTRQQLEKAMADAYFFKPIPVGEFLDAVQELMGISADKPPVPQGPALVEEAPRVGPPAAEARPIPAASPQEVPRTRRLLAELRAKLGANLAALVNRQGETLDLSGEISAEIDEWVAVLRLTSSMVESSGERARTLIFVPGSRFDFWVTPITPGTALVVGAPYPAWRQSAFGELAAALWNAAANLHLAADADALAADAIAADESGPDQALQSFDALLENLQSQTLNVVDINAFWDLAAEDHSVLGEREGSMNYEEARRLGLAPDED